MTPPIDAVDADVTKILAATGIRTGHTPLIGQGGGLDHRIYSTRAAGRRLLVKTAAFGGRFPAVAWAAGTLAAAGVPVPTILGYTGRVCVESRCEGRALVDDTTPSSGHQPTDFAVAAAAGVLLRRVHAITVTGYGRLDATGRGTHQDLHTWLLTRQPPPAADAPQAGLLERVHQTLRENAGCLTGTRPRLLHGDWAARHVITADTRITGLVDLASVRGGDPLTDLAGWSLQESAALTRAHFDGYFPNPPGEQTCTALTLYRLRIAASLLIFHTTHADTGNALLRTRQLHADLADLAAHTPRAVPRVSPETSVKTTGRHTHAVDPHP